MAYPRMTPTIGHLELAQTEGKVLGENRTRLGRREGRAPEMTDLDGEVTLRPDPSKRLPPKRRAQYLSQGERKPFFFFCVCG
eukprot:COSAG02_NODE_769_length_17369_cov_8.151013_12_plen_81_part_01